MVLKPLTKQANNTKQDMPPEGEGLAYFHLSPV